MTKRHRYPSETKRTNDKANARRATLADIKLARGCIDCGYNLHAEALHFDHRDPDSKEFGIAQNLLRNWETILLEVAKCDVRCANCHAVRSKELGHTR